MFLFHALVAQLDRAPPSEGGGCGFESRQAHHDFSLFCCSPLTESISKGITRIQRTRVTVMFERGFMILFHPPGAAHEDESALTVQAAIGTTADGVRADFLKQCEKGAVILGIVPLEDIHQWRRTIVALAEKTGRTLDIRG